jgi:hypothetical protein
MPSRNGVEALTFRAREPEVFATAGHCPPVTGTGVLAIALPEGNGTGIGSRHSSPTEDRMADDAKPDRIVKTTTEARQGIAPGVTRKVLVISLALAVIAFLAVYHFTVP